MAKWLDNAIFYEIYPQSFLDTNGAHQETTVKVELPEKEENYFDIAKKRNKEAENNKKEELFRND